MQPVTNELNVFSREDVNKMGGQAMAAYDKSPAEEVVDSSRKTFSSPACEGFFENIITTTTTTTTTSSWKGDHHCQVVLAFKGTSTMSELFFTDSRAHPTHFLQCLPKGSFIHWGFYKAFKDSWDQIKNILEVYAAKQDLTDHSL